MGVITPISLGCYTIFHLFFNVVFQVLDTVLCGFMCVCVCTHIHKRQIYLFTYPPIFKFSQQSLEVDIMFTLQMRKLRLREFKYFLRGHPARMKGGELVQTAIPKGFPGCSVVKNQPAMQEIWVQYLDWEDSLQKQMASCSRILAWKIPWSFQSLVFFSVKLSCFSLTCGVELEQDS